MLWQQLSAFGQTAQLEARRETSNDLPGNTLERRTFTRAVVLAASDRARHNLNCASGLVDSSNVTFRAPPPP